MSRGEVLNLKDARPETFSTLVQGNKFIVLNRTQVNLPCNELLLLLLLSRFSRVRLSVTP